MNALLVLLALLASVQAFAQTPTPSALGTDTESGSFAGEMDITPSGDEPIHLNFQYGQAPELSNGSPQAIADLADNIAHVQTAIQGQESAVFYVPEGSESAELPAALVEKVHPQKVIVPRALLDQFKTVFRDSYVSPTSTEKTMGIVFGSTRAVISGIVWFSAPGVSPELATLMTISIAGISGFNTVFNQTLNNLFSYGLAAPTTRGGKIYRSTVLMARSAAYDFVFSNLLNVFSGMRNTLAQNATNFVASGALSNVVGAQRNTMLAGKRYLNISYTMLIAPFTYTINALEATGTLHAVFTVGFYEVRPTMLATFAIYSTLIVANTFAKDKVIGLLQKVDASMSRLITAVSSKFTRITQGFCDEVMSGPGDTERF